MRNILMELYYGNIRTDEDLLLCGQEYRKAAERACSAESALLSTLDDAGHELYMQLEIASAAQDSIEFARIYADGFRTGVNIMLACLSRCEECSKT